MAFSQDVRSRNLFWINASTFSWNLGLGASIPVVPLLALEFLKGASGAETSGSDLAMAGFVVAIGGAARLFSGYFTGPLVDRFGRLGVTRLGVLLRMIFSFMEGLSGSYWSLVVYRFFSSIGTSVYGTGVSVMMADIATRRDRGRIAGGRSSLAQFGNVLGPAVGTALWAWSGDLRTPFLFNGCTKLVCMIIFLFCVKETQGYGSEPVTVAPKPAEEPAPVAAAAVAVGASRAAADKEEGEAELHKVLRSGPFVLTLYSAFAAAVFQQGVQYTVLAVWIKDVITLPASEIGWVLSSINLGQLLIGFPAGRLVDRYGIRAGIIPGSIIAAASLGFLSLTSAASVPWGFIMGCGTGLLMVTSQAYAMDIAPRKARGHFFGINQSAQSGANLVGPLIVGFVTDHLGYGAAFGAVAFMLAGVVPMALAWVKEQPVKAEPEPAKVPA